MFQLGQFLAGLLTLAVLFTFHPSLLPKQSVALAKATQAPNLGWTLKMSKSCVSLSDANKARFFFAIKGRMV
jgi:hypothetical protein